MSKPISFLLHSFLLLVLIGTFSSIVYYLNEEPGVTAAAAFTPTVPAPRIMATAIFTLTLASSPVPTLSPPPTATPDPSWQRLQPGLERRVVDIYNGQNQRVESVYIWRLDQKYFRLDVAYHDRPQTLEAWQQETNAAIVLNGGYYSIDADERYSPDGLTIVNGKASGRSFNRPGGMLAIGEDQAELRWLAEKPYNAYEPLQAALQSFPILVEPGGRLGYGAEKESYAQARRTVLAQDKNGRILFLVAPEGYFTLHQLSLYLTQSDLNLDIAVNLDGGGSTGILVSNPRDLIPPTRPIPFVILVYPR